MSGLVVGRGPDFSAAAVIDMDIWFPAQLVCAVCGTRKPFEAMAHNGFCSNEQIIKSIKKRFQNVAFFLVTPELLFLEEFLIFLEESSALEGLSNAFIMQTGKQKYNELTMAERMRYVKLATEMNAWAFNG